MKSQFVVVTLCQQRQVIVLNVQHFPKGVAIHFLISIFCSVSLFAVPALVDDELYQLRQNLVGKQQSLVRES